MPNPLLGHPGAFLTATEMLMKSRIQHRYWILDPLYHYPIPTDYQGFEAFFLARREIIKKSFIEGPRDSVITILTRFMPLSFGTFHDQHFETSIDGGPFSGDFHVASTYSEALKLHEIITDAMDPPSRNPHMTLQPPSILLMGETGTGKTDSLLTYIEAGLELFVLSTEPNGIESLIDSVHRRKLSIDKLHYHQLLPTAVGWDSQLDLATMTNTKSYEALASMKEGIAKPKQDAWRNVLLSCKNFVCDRTGEDYGDVTEWGPSRAFVIDTLSGLNQMARENHVGLKLSMHQGEWGVAMGTEHNLIFKLTSDRHCFFTLTAHMDRELDEIAQTTKLMVSALGRKLAPQLPKLFSEVVMTKKTGLAFTWATTDPQAALKNRALPLSPSLPPSFVPIVRAHEARVAQTQPSTTSPVTPEKHT